MKNEQLVIDNDDGGDDDDVDVDVDEDEVGDDVDMQGAEEEQEAAAAPEETTSTTTNDEKKKTTTATTRMSNTQLREQAFGFHLLTAKANLDKDEALRIIGVANTVAQQKSERDDSRDELFDDFLAAKKDFITRLKKLQKKVKNSEDDASKKNKKKQQTSKKGAFIQVQFLPFFHNGRNYLKADITIDGNHGPAIKALNTNGQFCDVGWFDQKNDTIVANG